MFRAWCIAAAIGCLQSGGVPAVPAPAPIPAPPAPGKPAFAWYTQFGTEVLGVVDGVLVGKVEEVTGLRGIDVVRVAIVEWCYGARPRALAGEAKEVTLMASPGDFFLGTEQMLFLKLFEGGPRYAVHNRIARSDPDWDAKRACLDWNLGLQKVEKDEDRRREVRKRLYDDLSDRSNWTRWHAYHELAWLRAKQKELVTWDDREDLRKLAARLEDEKLKTALTKVLKEWDK